MKRAIFIILVIAAVSISAQGKAFPYSGGSGTAEEPYRIATASDLTELAGATNDYDANFIVTADIDLSSAGVFTTAVIARDTDNSNWDFDGNAFTGVFDGNGHTISNMTINSGGEGNDYLGLFGYLDEGTVKNLQLSNISITGGNYSNYIGGLAGADWNWADINNCSATGEVTSGDYSVCIGGLIGNETGEIRDCHSAVTVTGGYYSQYIGGLAGDGYIISNCYSTGDVRGGDYSSQLGGLVGIADIIDNCHSTGSVSGGNVSYDSGGLAGEIYESISICYSTGAITGGTDCGRFGGLAGRNDDGIISNCFSTGNVSATDRAQRFGGLVGYNYNYEQGGIYNCYTTGLVSGGINSSDLGGLVGYNDPLGIISNCYFHISSGPDNGYGDPLTSEQMMQQASFVGWDFTGEKANGVEDIWKIYEGLSYPLLGWLDVTKCTVTAGSKDNSDKISITGQLDTGANYYFSSGNAIEITVKSNHMADYYEPTFDINNKTFKKGKYSCSKTENGVKESFKYDTKTRRFILTGSNINLAGLNCPVMMHITIGDYHGTDVFDEDIVNGKKPMPIVLMMGEQNALRVDKISVKQGKTAGSDQLTVSGGFAFADTNLNMTNWDLNITLNGVPYTIGAGKMIAKKTGFGCSNAPLEDGVSIGTVDFNFKKSTFKATIKKTEVEDLHGLVEFGMMIGTDYDENVEVELP